MVVLTKDLSLSYCLAIFSLTRNKIVCFNVRVYSSFILFLALLLWYNLSCRQINILVSNIFVEAYSTRSVALHSLFNFRFILRGRRIYLSLLFKRLLNIDHFFSNRIFN